MQFDHTGSDKNFHIGQFWYRIDTKALLSEIAQCEVVCANCHAVRTVLRSHLRRVARGAKFSVSVLAQRDSCED